ncbi:BsuPI-related putative proteinase inhibitor [Algicola sagamiensis]|uniref:BsuPI-related putative proteinase inhibitor n=1 Tax=Algicola sagamiensis TaxID=163869 RepID=UPI00035CB0AE|nr:BsuPI-related putative proteinase inhibitor [Algicola sagamiensis]
MKTMILSTLLSALSITSYAADFFPYQQDDKAIFKLNVVDGRPVEHQSQVYISDIDDKWQLMKNFLGQDLWVHSEEGTGRVYLRNPETKEENLLVDFNADVGQKFEQNILPCVASTEILSKKADLTIGKAPYGGLTRVYFNLQEACRGSGLNSAWFDREIGLVQWTVTAGRYQLRTDYYQLVRANIDNKNYPHQQYGNIDVNAQFPAQHIKYPDIREITATLSVTNHQSGDVQFKYGTGYPVEMEILDINGNVLNRWSDGKSFFTILPPRTLPAGDTMDYQLTIPVRDDQGIALDTGVYEIRMTYMGQLVGEDELPHYKVTAPIKVTRVYVN